MDFLQLNGKTILVVGVANRKSVAWHTSRVLAEAGADVIYSVRSSERRDSLRKMVGDEPPIYVCDVEQQDHLDRLRDQAGNDRPQLHGIVHSLAFADYSAGWLPFHETPRSAFLQAVDVYREIMERFE